MKTTAQRRQEERRRLYLEAKRLGVDASPPRRQLLSEDDVERIRRKVTGRTRRV